MVSVNYSLLIQIVNFLFLIWALNLVLFRPIRGILRQRKEKIDGLESRIEQADRDGKEKNVAFSAGLKEARVKGMQAKDALISEATDEEKQITEEITAKAQQELAAVRERIAKETEEVRSALHKDVDAFAQSIGEKILGRVVG